MSRDPELVPVTTSNALDWTKERIVVTGGAGFLGSHLIEALHARGATNVFVPRSRDYDLVDSSAVASLFREAKPTLLFHLAARVGGIGANSKYPGSLFYDNLMMGTQTLEQARLSGVRKVVALGTICAYPRDTPVPFKETDLWSGYPEETNAAYGLAKKMLVVQSKAYRTQYGFNSVVLLPVNLYGPGDNFDPETSHVIPALIRKFQDARETGARQIVAWGDGSASREFLHVRDAARAILLAAERYDSSDPINIGSGRELTIKTLTTLIGQLTGFTGSVEWDHTKPNGQPRRRLDVSRAEQLLGFKAAVDLEEGLRETISWYRHLDGDSH